MANDRITKEQYEQRLRDWAEKARSEMRSKIYKDTYGTGTLEKKLKVSVKESRRDSNHYIGFNFRRYGVFVAYGVGRGWVRQGGTVVRGSRVKKGSDLEKQLRSKGYSKKDISSYVVGGSSSGEGRKPVDWFDSVLLSHMEELAAIAQEYYGDYSMDKLDEMVRRMTIRKETGRSS